MNDGTSMDPTVESAEKVVRIIKRASPSIAGREINTSHDLREELGLDSNTLMAIAFRLEKEFGVDITAHAEELSGLRTVGDVARFFHQVSRRGA